MSFLNWNFGLIAFEDQNVTTPQIRSLDVSRSLTGVTISNEQTLKADLAAGGSKVVAATARALTHDGTTQYSIVQPWAAESSRVRLEWTGVGTAPGFATKRSIGLVASSVVTLSRVNSSTMRISSPALNSAAVQVGDMVRFEATTDSFTSVFSAANWGSWRVLATGVGTIDVLDNGVMSQEVATLSGVVDKQVRAFSNGPAKIGDILDISGQNPNNVGQWQVTDIAYDYVEFVNPYAVAEVFLNTANVQVYDRLIGFLYIRSLGEVSIRINDGEPITLMQMGPNEAFFMGSVRAYKVELVNETVNSVSATVHHASIC
jgi:hypothetical protein